MIKAWFISFLVLLLLGAAIYLGIFEWLAGGKAKLISLGAVSLMLVAAFFILGNPLKTPDKK